MHSHRTSLLVVACVAVVSLAAGCGGDDDPKDATPQSTPTASLTGPGTDASENFTTGDEFARALADNTPESLAKAEDLVAPKSAASRYLEDAADAVDQGPLTLTETGTGRYELCAGSDCTVLSDLVLADGRISSFKVDGKQAR